MEHTMARRVALVLSMFVALAICGRAVLAQSAAQATANPLLAPSRLPFQAPPFADIKDEHFAPAFDEGMRQQDAEVAAIADNTAAATFDNTLVALERSGQTLARVQMAFNALTSANTNDALTKL